jgi:putative FmdB family regulatory protein
MLYPYFCDSCDKAFDVSKSMSIATRPEPCPTCGRVVREQNLAAKTIRGHVSTEAAWTSGKMIPQLHPAHPDRMVTSKRQMEAVYKKHGIDLDTGKFVSKEAQIKATVPRHLRTGAVPGAVSGVQEKS